MRVTPEIFGWQVDNNAKHSSTLNPPVSGFFCSNLA